jgi:hypothetical protein
MNAQILPRITRKQRISQDRAELIREIGRPLPFNQHVIWLWIAWIAAAFLLLFAHIIFRSFKEITTLEPSALTLLIRTAAAFIGTLILFDLFQCVAIWSELRGLLRALNRERFKRSFVPIEGFDWRKLWSLTGTSRDAWAAIVTLQYQCIVDPKSKELFNGFFSSKKEKEQFGKYTKLDLSKISSATYSFDRKAISKRMAQAAEVAYALAANYQTPEQPEQTSADPTVEALQMIQACASAQKEGRFSEDAKELASCPDQVRNAEKLICLVYISYIQTIIARLHSLLVSVGAMFSLTTLGIAIYPFAPFTPFLCLGAIWLLVICWAFFKVFSEMDTDPILSRIVNGDDRKLQSNFYLRFGEAVALPLLTLGSSMLPGGVGRLLDVAQSMLSHSQ